MKCRCLHQPLMPVMLHHTQLLRHLLQQLPQQLMMLWHHQLLLQALSFRQRHVLNHASLQAYLVMEMLCRTPCSQQSCQVHWMLLQLSQRLSAHLAVAACSDKSDAPVLATCLQCSRKSRSSTHKPLVLQTSSVLSGPVCLMSARTVHMMLISMMQRHCHRSLASTGQACNGCIHYGLCQQPDSRNMNLLASLADGSGDAGAAEGQGVGLPASPPHSPLVPPPAPPPRELSPVKQFAQEVRSKAKWGPAVDVNVRGLMASGAMAGQPVHIQLKHKDPVYLQGGTRRLCSSPSGLAWTAQTFIIACMQSIIADQISELHVNLAWLTLP